MEFKPARCPSCGGELQVPDEMNTVKCMYCGNEIIVKEAIKAATTTVNQDNILELADTALMLRNYEEAYNYYNRVLELDINNYKAWYGKVLSDTGRKTDISQIDINNIIRLIKIAIENAPNDKKDEILSQLIIKLSNMVLVNYNKLLVNFENSDITEDSYELFFYKSNLAINLFSELNKFTLNKGMFLNDILQIYENYISLSENAKIPVVLCYDEKIEVLAKIKKIELELERIRVGPDKIIVGPRQEVKCACGYVGFPKMLRDSTLICRKCKIPLSNIYISEFL